LVRLKASYQRLFQRYENSLKLIAPDQVKLERKDNLQSVLEVQAEQQKLREALQGLEKRRLDRWKTALTAGKNTKPKLVVVSVTGGANRSAVWTANTLIKLE